MSRAVILVVAAPAGSKELAAALESSGAALAVADSAGEAVRAIRSRRPDLAIVDTTGPELDGLDVIARLRATADTVLPVIAVVAPGDDAARNEVVAAGADELITRPLSAIDLELRVRAMLRLRRATEDLSHATATLAATAVTDPLTALYNTRGFATFLDRELARSRRYGRVLSLLLIDVDGLGRINDVNGRAAGDRVLCDLADIIRREIRVPDVAAREDAMLRVLAPETPVEAALAMAERLRREVNQTASATISIGVAGFPSVTATSADQLVDLAAEALRRAKAAGKNCCRSA